MVKALFDTSVLVAAFVVGHPRHGDCLPYLQRVRDGQIQGFIATHTLAEVYAVLTRLPVSPRISLVVAQRLIEENLREFEAIALMAEDYRAVIVQMANLNLAGGAIYDALIARAAVKAEIEELLTLNPNHFTRLGEEIARLVRVPLS